jgi:hypothetical protein
MKTFVIINTLAFCMLTVGSAAKGQTTAPVPSPSSETGIAATRVFGEVTSIDAASLRMTVRTKAGDFDVLLNDKTKYLRVPPGEETMEKAETIALGHISIGDRVIARGHVSAEQKSVQARQIVVMSKAAIAQRLAHGREEWRRRGIVGRISALKPETNGIILLTGTSAGEKQVALSVFEKATFRRYAPDTVKFADTLPSSFNELKVGDQVRALGEKSADGTSFTAEEIVSGSFRVVSGKITAINVEASEITLTDLQTKQPTTVVITKDSLMRRLSPDIISMLMQQLAPAAANGTRSAANAAETQEKLENLPAMTITDLKLGDAVRVSSTRGTNPARVTAIGLAAGVEELLKAQQGGKSSMPVNASLGLSSGALDGIGLP